MSRYFVCCDECFRTVGQRSGQAARLWINLCNARRVKGPVFEVYDSDLPELRTLELLGYITTTETANSLSVKVNGYHVSESSAAFFCLNCEEHEECDDE